MPLHGSVQSLNGTPAPPDGGWGWVVVFASFMIHIVSDGVTYSFGVFYVQFLDYFQSGKGETAWIPSILVGVTLCSGPIASIFVNKYGCRPVTIAGAILAAVTLMISVYAKSIYTLYITIGLGTGLGLGLIYLPAIVSVTTYFEKYRSLATGIAVCGSGFGTFIFAPIIEELNKAYGWKGAILIIGFIVLSCILFGALFRPLEMNEDDDANSKIKECSHTKMNGEELKPLKSATDDSLHASNPNLNNINDTNDSKMQRPQSMGHFTMPRASKTSTNSVIPQTTVVTQNGNVVTSQINSNGITKSPEKGQLTLSQPLLNADFGSQTIHSRRSLGIMSRPDILYQGSLTNLPQYYRSRHNINRDVQPQNFEDVIASNSVPNDTTFRSTILHQSSLTNIPQHCRSGKGNFDEIIIGNHHIKSNHSIYNDTTIQKETDETNCLCCTADTKETMKEMLDFSLFLDPVFILFTVSNFCTSIGFNIPYVYIVPQATSKNISSMDASYLLSVVGIANTVGRIILGYLSDKPWVNRLLVYNLCLTICGIATFCSAFCNDFYSLAVYSSVFGFTIGAYVGLTSVILVDLLGLDKLTNAFGLLLLFQGIASLIGPPLAGWLYDFLQSYNPGFYVAGVFIAISGVILFFIPPLQRYKTRKENIMKNQIM